MRSRKIHLLWLSRLLFLESYRMYYVTDKDAATSKTKNSCYILVVRLETAIQVRQVHADPPAGDEAATPAVNSPVKLLP